METYIIAGLGNPDRRYEGSRHNAGFACIDVLAEKLGMPLLTQRFNSLYTQVMRNGKKLILVKPLTYMNNSGEALSAWVKYFNISPDHLIVIFDDINFSCGRLRVRGNGSAGGHNGMKSIIALVGTENFPRIRVGVGNKPERMDLADYVLGKFYGTDKKIMEKSYEAAVQAALSIIDNGIVKTMSDFNGITISLEDSVS